MKNVYVITASDRYMQKSYDKVISICEEKKLEETLCKALKQIGCDNITAKITVEACLNNGSTQIDRIFTKIDLKKGGFDEGSEAYNITLRFVKVELNKVDSY